MLCVFTIGNLSGNSTVADLCQACRRIAQKHHSQNTKTSQTEEKVNQHHIFECPVVAFSFTFIEPG